ncbi:hypothetical protein F5887DRAFT_1143385 [Amanita rubescens]|nr:hypothetical protein F5887DRAFT_1143385 [Amanita rubescens]
MVLRPITRRDAFLILFGAASMQVWSFLFNPALNNHMVITTDLTPDLSTATTTATIPTPTVCSEKNILLDPLAGPPTALSSLPHTSIAAHAPGWTLFRDLYMSNGTLLIVSPSKEDFPETRMMTSTGLSAENTPENIALREPTKETMDFLTPEQAQQRWGSKDESAYRVLSVKGNTILYNDPEQFLRHYYHFVAELFLGTWAFWQGAFTQPSPTLSLSLSLPQDDSAPPPIHRAIFIHSNEEGWHDRPGFNGYFLRAALPSLPVESQLSWEDLVRSTRPVDNSDKNQKAFHFPYALLVDRSAAHRGFICGSQTQRTAAEAWQYMLTNFRLVGVHAGRWWDPIRESVWRFAGVKSADAVNWMNLVRSGAFQDLLPKPKKITISYISRQPSRGRKLTPESHDGLVSALRELVDRRNSARTAANSGEGEVAEEPEWEFHQVIAEWLSKDEQIQVAARTTFLVGVHGNGLTHLVFMPPTRVSTVIEIFYPQGYAHDYQWTSTALGMKHYGVWNDTYFSLPQKEPPVGYPPGFQDDYIPVHGPAVAKLIEDRVDGA